MRHDDALAYARRILVNASVDAWRKRHGEVVSDEAVAAHEPVAASGFEQVEEHDRVGRMLATLPPQQRRVVVRRYYADLSEREVADGVPVYSCASDPAAFPTRSGGTGWMESGPGTWTDTPYDGSGEQVAALDYGNALRLGDFMCSSAESGVTCTNTATGHAVKLNRQEIVLR